MKNALNGISEKNRLIVAQELSMRLEIGETTWESDFLTGLLEDLEKMVWMLRSHLQ